MFVYLLSAWNVTNKNEFNFLFLTGENITINMYMLHVKYFASSKRKLKYNKNLKMSAKDRIPMGNIRRKERNNDREGERSYDHSIKCKMNEIIMCVLGNCITDWSLTYFNSSSESIGLCFGFGFVEMIVKGRREGCNFLHLEMRSIFFISGCCCCCWCC